MPTLPRRAVARLAALALAVTLPAGLLVAPPAADAASGGLVISRSALLARPTSGTAWKALLADARASWPAHDPGDANLARARYVVAGALVAARTGDAAMRRKVVSALEQVRAGRWWTDFLAMARTLPGYVIAADLVGYHPRAWVDYLVAARTRVVDDHPRWRTLAFTAGDTANNYGGWSLAAMTAIDRFLQLHAGREDLRREWAIYADYTRTYPQRFRRTADWDRAWSSRACQDRPYAHYLPVAINTGGGAKDGAWVEDASRSAGSTLDAAGAMYTWEMTRAVTTAAMILRRAGYAPFASGRALPRLHGFLRRTGWRTSLDGTLWGYSEYGHNGWARVALNHFLGRHHADGGSTRGDRHFGYADWLWP
jgi:hypothetical protein